MRELYLAGGCFWGMEKTLKALDGVVDTETGYANGRTESPSYEDVCTDTTGHRETVKVIYDPDIVSLETLLRAFFICVNPMQKNRQGNDIGTQYQSGVYTTDAESETFVRQYMENKRKDYPSFYTEYGPLKSFWPAEEYHQDYLDKNPQGYCHISNAEYELVKQLNTEVRTHD